VVKATLEDRTDREVVGEFRESIGQDLGVSRVPALLFQRGPHGFDVAMASGALTRRRAGRRSRAGS